jgi:3-oxoacyl-[acyl-carrier protein] reductase
MRVAAQRPLSHRGIAEDREMDDLNGRVALVTGSSRGIGRAVAIALAHSGADVVINFLKRSEEARSVAKHIHGLGRRSISLQADVSVASDVANLFSTIKEQFGPVDLLVNNAGIARPQRVEEISETDWDEVIAANLKSCFLVTQAAFPHMRSQKWGRVINVSSVAAQVGGIVGPHYASSKAGMIGMTHFYAQLLIKEGITVNAIAPALIDTDMVAANPNADPAKVPVGRFGSPDEVAEAAVMLARNGYITGQTINVNGGWYMS